MEVKLLKVSMLELVQPGLGLEAVMCRQLELACLMTLIVMSLESF